MRPHSLPFWKSSFVDNYAASMVVIRASCIRASVQMLSFCYIFVVQKAASAGDCSFPDEHATVPVLDSNESVRCTLDGELWPYMAAVGGGVFLLYGVIAPYQLYKLLKRAHRGTGDKARYANPVFQSMPVCARERQCFAFPCWPLVC